MGGQDCDGSTLPQAPIGSLPIRSDGLPCQSPTDDDRQISSEDRRSVKLRVRPPPAGTHQCHRATSAGSGMMLTVKLTKSSSSDPQDTGLQSVANPPYWAPKAAVSLNLTIPRLAHRVETAIAFRLHNALGTQNERSFVAVNPTAHSLACLRIGVFVTADAARLATGVGGSPFTGRVSHPLDGEQSFMTSPHRHSPLTSLAWSHHATTPVGTPAA